MEQNTNRICKKCLLQEMDAEYFKSLSLYIKHLDEDLKVDDAKYETRLSICKDCDKLANGMCRACGCFVELRGAMKKNSCPYDKW